MRGNSPECCGNTCRIWNSWELWGLALMSLLGIYALAVGFGSLVLIGILVLVRELFSDSIFGIPSESDEKARQGHADQTPSASSSLTSSR
jgi:hypothetical protein